MKRFFFCLATFFMGFFLHLLVSRAVHVFGVSPNVLLPLSLSLGLSRGAVFGETVGFFWGLSVDALGMGLFGAQGLLLALAGYFGGRLHRRFNTAYVYAQVVLIVIGTFLYSLSLLLIEKIFLGSVRPFAGWWVCGMVGLNALLAPVLFFGSERWLKLWLVPARF